MFASQKGGVLQWLSARRGRCRNLNGSGTATPPISLLGRYCRFHYGDSDPLLRHMISTVGEYVHPTFCGTKRETENEWLIKNPWGKEIDATVSLRRWRQARQRQLPVPDADSDHCLPSELDFAGYKHTKGCKGGPYA